MPGQFAPPHHRTAMTEVLYGTARRRRVDLTAPNGPALTDIGAPLRSLARAPGSPTAPLPGSRTMVHRSNTRAEDAEDAAQPAVRVTRCPSYSHDPRVQCAPGHVPFGAGFAAVGLGRNIDTGEAW